MSWAGLDDGGREKMAAPHGLEPWLSDSESDVLPLNDRATLNCESFILSRVPKFSRKIVYFKIQPPPNTKSP